MPRTLSFVRLRGGRTRREVYTAAALSSSPARVRPSTTKSSSSVRYRPTPARARRARASPQPASVVPRQRLTRREHVVVAGNVVSGRTVGDGTTATDGNVYNEATLTTSPPPFSPLRTSEWRPKQPPEKERPQTPFGKTVARLATRVSPFGRAPLTGDWRPTPICQRR